MSDSKHWYWKQLSEWRKRNERGDFDEPAELIAERERKQAERERKQAERQARQDAATSDEMRATEARIDGLEDELAEWEAGGITTAREPHRQKLIARLEQLRAHRVRLQSGEDAGMP